MEELQVKPKGKFGPVWTAMVTPFTEGGDIDFEACGRLIDYLIETGTDVLVVAGTTGESPLLKDKEKIELFHYCVQYSNGRVPIVAGTGSNSTKASIALTQEAEQVGVDGVMLVTPYYNKPSQHGLIAHFTAIADKTVLPVMLYNVPGRTGINMEAQTTIELSKHANISAIKEASGDLDQIAAIIEYTDESFAVYSGDDGIALPVLALGGDGVVSVAAHVIGRELKGLVQAFQAGERKIAADTHRKLLPVMKAMFLAPNPTCVKYSLNKIGVHVGEVQLPLIPLNNQEKKRVDLALKSLK